MDKPNRMTYLDRMGLLALVEQKDARIKDLREALQALDTRLRACFGIAAEAREIYDSFYQEVVRAALSKEDNDGQA